MSALDCEASLSPAVSAGGCPGVTSFRDVLNSLSGRVRIVASLKPKLFCGVASIDEKGFTSARACAGADG